MFRYLRISVLANQLQVRRPIRPRLRDEDTGRRKMNFSDADQSGAFDKTKENGSHLKSNKSDGKSVVALGGRAEISSCRDAGVSKNITDPSTRTHRA